MSSITAIINNYKMCFKSWLLICFVMMFDTITAMSTHWAIRCCQRTSESIIKLLYHPVYLIDALCVLKTLYFLDHRSYGFCIKAASLNCHSFLNFIYSDIERPSVIRSEDKYKSFRQKRNGLFFYLTRCILIKCPLINFLSSPFCFIYI